MISYNTNRCYAVYEPVTLTAVGEVRYDAIRKRNKWTALNDQGRIQDCHDRETAEKLVLDAYHHQAL